MDEHMDGAAVDRLRELGVRGVLLLMAKNGQILEVRCEMPQCYCPKGRKHFDDKSASSRDWTLSFDHHPRLASDGGRREPGNARLSHVLCNRVDYGWRLKIRAMLNKGMPLEAIAEKLNRSKVRAPHGSGKWTAATVRKAQVS